MRCERVFQTFWCIHGMEKGVAVCCSKAWVHTRPGPASLVCLDAVTRRRRRGQCPLHAAGI